MLLKLTKQPLLKTDQSLNQHIAGVTLHSHNPAVTIYFIKHTLFTPSSGYINKPPYRVHIHINNTCTHTYQSCKQDTECMVLKPLVQQYRLTGSTSPPQTSGFSINDCPNAQGKENTTSGQQNENLFPISQLDKYMFWQGPDLLIEQYN